MRHPAPLILSLALLFEAALGLAPNASQSLAAQRARSRGAAEQVGGRRRRDGNEDPAAGGLHESRRDQPLERRRHAREQRSCREQDERR